MMGTNDAWSPWWQIDIDKLKAELAPFEEYKG